MRRNWFVGGLCVTVCVLGLAPSGFGDGFRNPPEGGAALGRSGVRLTQGDDPSAITHNPANLLDLKGGQVMPSFTVGYSKTTFTSPWGAREKSDDPWTVLPAVYATFPMKDGTYAAGVGVSVPYGQASTWDRDGLFQFVAPTFAEMSSVNINPTFAVKVAPNVHVGVGVDVMWSSLEFEQSLPWMPLPAGFGGPGSLMKFDGDGYGIGANAGVTWQMTPRQRLAVVYRSPISVDYSGDFVTVNPPPPGMMPPMITPTSDFETEIDFPTVVGFGYGVQATDTLRVEANVEWIEHSRNQRMPIDIENNNAILLAAMGTTDLPQDWDDTWTVGIGADWKLSDALTLRGGWTYLPTPVPEETMTPVLAEGDKNIFAVGLGFCRAAHRVDAAYALALSEDRTVDALQNPVKGRYEFESSLFSLSYAFTF
jgi:long-chain fatty acid transport protein